MEAENCGCLDCFNFKKDPQEALTSTAMLLISVGVAICCLAFLYPTDNYFDPRLPAAEMEEIELRQSETQHWLNIVQLVGIGVVGLGGVIIAGVIMKMVVNGDFIRCMATERRLDEERLGLSKADDLGQSYGADMEEVIVFDKSA